MARKKNIEKKMKGSKMAANVVIMEVLNVSDLYVRSVKSAYVPALMREKPSPGVTTQNVTYAKLETSEGLLDVPVFPGVDVPRGWSGKAKVIVSLISQARQIKEFSLISSFFKPDFLFAFKAISENAFAVASFDDGPAPLPASAGVTVPPPPVGSGSGSGARLHLKN